LGAGSAAEAPGAAIAPESRRNSVRPELARNAYIRVVFASILPGNDLMEHP